MEWKIIELENVNGIVEKLDAHYGFLMLKNCFSLLKLLYLLRTNTCFIQPALLEKYDKTVREELSKVCNVNYDDISSTQLAMLSEMGSLGVSSASLLALPAILASASGASDFLKTIFSEAFENVSFTKALQKWLSLTNEQESPLDRTQKNWTQPVFVKTAQDLISRLDDKRSKVFNGHQGKFGSQWLNVVPFKNLGLKLDDQRLRIPIGLRLGAVYSLFAESHFVESHFAESMGHLAEFLFGKVGIENRQSGQGSCLLLQKQTFRAIK